MSRRDRAQSSIDKSAHPSGDSRGSWDVAGLLALLAALLVYFQYHTVGKFAKLPPVKRFDSIDDLLLVTRRLVPLDAADAALAALILASCALLLFLELREHRLTRFFDKVFESESRTRLFLALSSLILVRFYFAPGESSWVADTNFHNTYAWITSQSFSRGEIPIWTNYLCTGSPFLQFYGFLFFYLVGLFDLVFRDIFFSIKWVLALGHVASGVGMYLFVSALLRSRRAGFLAGIAYVLTFWHTQHVLMMGRLPLSVFYGLLPWPYYFCERLRLRSRRLPSAIGGAITLACLIFTHPGYGFWAAVFLAVHLVLRPLLASRNLFTVKHSLLLFFGGLVLSAYLVLPMWAERAYTGLHAGFSMSHWPRPTWQHLIYWSNHRFVLFTLPEGQHHWYGGYLGVSLVLLCLAGLAAAFAFRRHARISSGLTPGICLALSLILVFGYDWPVLRTLGVVQALHAGRYLLFVVFFMSVLVGVAAAGAVTVRTRRCAGTRLFTLALLVVLADLGPTTFQHSYLPPERALKLLPIPEEAVIQTSPARIGELPDRRIYYSRIDTWATLVVSQLVFRTGLPTVFGLFDEHPLTIPGFIRPLEKLMDPPLVDLRDPDRLADEFGPIGKLYDFAAGFGLLNVEPIWAYQTTNQLLVRLLYPYPTPVTVSGKAVSWHYPVERFKSLGESETEIAFRDLLKGMGVDATEGTCRQIPLRTLASPVDLGTLPKVEVLSHRVWNQRVELHVRTSDECFARLAYAYYPYLEVVVDGQTVEPLETADRFIALRLDRGEHRIVLEPFLSPLRRALLALDIVLLVAAGSFLVRRRRSRS